MADPAEIRAEGRRLLAEATDGPWHQMAAAAWSGTNEDPDLVADCPLYADAIAIVWLRNHADALLADPAPEPTLTGEETVNWYGLLRSAAAILPEVETPERLLVAARNLAADIDAALAPYPTSFYLPSAAPVPEGVPEDHRVCSHGIYHHGCLSCDRQDPEERL